MIGMQNFQDKRSVIHSFFKLHDNTFKYCFNHPRGFLRLCLNLKVLILETVSLHPLKTAESAIYD